jgi:hypothetical protein
MTRGKTYRVKGPSRATRSMWHSSPEYFSRSLSATTTTEETPSSPPSWAPLRAACERSDDRRGRRALGNVRADVGRDNDSRSSWPVGEDLLNLAAVWTLERSGSVHVLEHPRMPDQREIAAIFRY